MLSALAMATERVRLGHMVVCTGFRNPALTAKMSSTIDVISGGRFELGIGAGWKEEEWRAYGYGFPTIGERMDALGDHLEVDPRDVRARAGDLRGRVRQRPRRDQRAEGRPGAAHPDHRRRQRRAGDRRLRDPLRRRAQLRVPARRRDRGADGRRPRALRGGGSRPGDAALLAVRPRRGDARGRPGAGRRRSAALAEIGLDRIVVLPDALVADARGPGGLRRGLPGGGRRRWRRARAARRPGQPAVAADPTEPPERRVRNQARPTSSSSGTGP